MNGPRNIAGAIVRGDDLWGREDELRALWRLLDRGSALLVGPRRHGKSSLMVALHDRPQGDWRVVLFDVEFVETPEQFVLELASEVLPRLAEAGAEGPFSELLRAGRRPELLRTPLRHWLAERSWMEAADLLLDLLEQAPGRTLVVIDEFPMMVATLLEQSPTAAVSLLRWFRARRSRLRATPRFLLGGSVNIEPRLAALGHSPLLNDLQRFRVEPMPLPLAEDFVRAVLQTEAVRFEPGVPAQVIEVTGSGVHFYLQVLLDECISEALRHDRPIQTDDVRLLYDERVLGPANRARFAHLITRIRAHYGADAEGARLVLGLLGAQGSAGRTDLARSLKAAACPSDPDTVLARLEADYYVQVDGRCVRFADGVLRDWWVRNAPDPRRR